MSTRETLIVVSIFYNRVIWNKLINEAVVPFFKQMVFKNYSLHFSSRQGEHLVISLEVAVNNYAKLKEDISVFFGTFLELYPSETKTPIYPLDGLFMDYPNNRLFFDIEQEDIAKPIEINNRITLAIIGGLAIDKLNTESVFTFILYMQLGIIRAMYTNLNEARIAINQIQNHLNINGSDKEDTGQLTTEHSILLEQLCNSNHDILQEIVADIWNIDSCSADLLWLKEWIRSCKGFNDDEKMTESFILISNHIFNHMGLSGELLMQTYLNMYRKIFNDNLILL